MPYALLPVDELPAVGAIICCKWPGTQFQKDETVYVRGVLVLDAWVQIDPASQLRYGVVRVAYGTDMNAQTDDPNKMVIVDRDELSSCGLTKPTKFLFTKPRVKRIVWSTERFFPRQWDPRLVLGSVGPERVIEMAALIKAMG